MDNSIISGRLNPKLIKKQYVTQNEQDILNSARSSSNSDSSQSSASQESTTNSDRSTNDQSQDTIYEVGGMKINQINPKIHLLHNKKWIPKQYEVGRLVEGTGLWDCCGNGDHYSLYCDSLEARVKFEKEKLSKSENSRLEIERRNRRKETLLSHIKNSQLNPETIELKLTPEEQAINKVCSQDNAFNAPMLVSWLYRYYEEDLTVINGLTFLLKHLQTGEGCYLMVKNKVMNSIDRIYNYHRSEPKIQLQIISILGQLLDCNYTRGHLTRDAKVLRMVFSICHYFMNSKSHLENGIRCFAQCARSEACRKEMIEKNMIAYLIKFCKRYASNAPIVRTLLKIFNWVSTDEEKLQHIVQLKAIQITFISLKKHYTENSVLAPAIIFLSKAAKGNPYSMELLLKLKVIPFLIGALKVIYDDNNIQLEGLKLIQLLSKTSEGWKQISDTQGGWQSLCQGTVEGDALIHKLPGEFNNPGWCIGDTPYLPFLDRMKLAAAKASQSSLQPEVKSAWTPSSLRDYMGLSMSGQTLAINTEYHDIYFELISTLDMLPKPGEDKEVWFQRVHSYEAESEVKIEEMVATVQEMRRRDAFHRKMDNQKIALSKNGDEVLGTVKEMYVRGKRVTEKSLLEGDADLEETLGNIITDKVKEEEEEEAQ